MKSARLCALLLSLTCAPAYAQHPSADEDAPPGRPAMPLDTDAARVVEGINRFSIDLYKASIRPSDNLFISPASVSIAVGLAYRGAVGSTADELQAGMHYFANPNAYAPANGAVLKYLDYASENNRLSIANSVWIQTGMPLRADFAADMAAHYKAGIQRVDFRADHDAARQTINQWVETKTNDKIKGLLTPVDVAKDTRSVLVNAIYWKGGWRIPFKEELTKDASFRTLDRRKVTTSLMQLQSDFAVAERDGIQAIAIPYENFDVEMIVLMPKSAHALPDFEEKLTHEILAQWLAELEAARPRDTILTFPRMKLEWREDLKEALSGLGMTKPFDDSADFSAMAQLPYPAEPDARGFKIGSVIHKTLLDVDEEGSEAAAATAVVQIVVTAATRHPPRPKPPYIFRADKPFMFLLREIRTKTILFMGRYVAPAA